MEELRGQRRVVMPDLPGCGLSAPPATDCGVEFYVGFLREFTLKLGLTRTELFGSSMGCQIAARYAEEQAGQVRALVLSSPYGLAGQDQGRAGLLRCEALLRLEPLLPTLRRPQLILLAERDPLGGALQAERLRALLPGVVVLLLPGLGHLSYLQDPGEVARLVTVFLGPAAP